MACCDASSRPVFSRQRFTKIHKISFYDKLHLRQRFRDCEDITHEPHWLRSSIHRRRPPSSSTGTPPGWAKRSLGEDMPACPWSPSSCHTSRPSVGPTSCSPANTDGKNAELSLTCHFALFRNRPRYCRTIFRRSSHKTSLVRSLRINPCSFTWFIVRVFLPVSL